MYVSWASLMAQTLRICLQSKRLRFNPWVGKILWRKEWLHLDTNYFHFKVRKIVVVSVHSLSCVLLLVTPCTAACQASLSITNYWSLLKLMSIKSGMPSNHLILCRPLLLPPSIFFRLRVFSNESALRISWPKYWSFSFNISPSRTDLL